MKILVISDTHRNLHLPQIAMDYCKGQGIHTLIHCGDHITDAKKLEVQNPEWTVYAVAGNCDWDQSGENRELVVVIDGVKCFVAHGDRQDVKYNYDEAYIEADAYDAKLALFGHSHSAYVEFREEITLLNPGSVAQPRDTQFPSFAIVTLENQSVSQVEILQIQGVNTIVPHPYFI